MVVVEVVGEEVEVEGVVGVLAQDMGLDMDQEKDLDMEVQVEDMDKEEEEVVAVEGEAALEGMVLDMVPDMGREVA